MFYTLTYNEYQHAPPKKLDNDNLTNNDNDKKSLLRRKIPKFEKRANNQQKIAGILYDGKLFCLLRVETKTQRSGASNRRKKTTTKKQGLRLPGEWNFGPFTDH